MLMETVATLGQALAENFELEPKNQVVYEDKENIYNYLSKNTLPVDMPALAYQISSVSPRSQKKGSFDFQLNSNSTIITKLKPLYISVDISCLLLCSTLKEQFKIINDYFSLLAFSTFSVYAEIEGNKEPFDVSITDLKEVSIPPGGKEGRDYDRGRYFVVEGGFSITTMMLYTEENKLIRNVNFEWDVKFGSQGE